MNEAGRMYASGTPSFAPDFEMSLMLQGISVPSNKRISAIQLVAVRSSRRAMGEISTSAEPSSDVSSDGKPATGEGGLGIGATA